MSGSAGISQNSLAFELAERNYLYPITCEPEIFSKCDECNDPIYFGDYYYCIGLENYCENCMKDLFMRIADG